MESDFVDHSAEMIKLTKLFAGTSKWRINHIISSYGHFHFCHRPLQPTRSHTRVEISFAQPFGAAILSSLDGRPFELSKSQRESIKGRNSRLGLINETFIS
jgi:hypothetical protein